MFSIEYQCIVFPKVLSPFALFFLSFYKPCIVLFEIAGLVTNNSSFSGITFFLSVSYVFFSPLIIISDHPILKVLLVCALLDVVMYSSLM